MIDSIFSNRRQPTSENRCPADTKAVGYIEGYYGKWKPLCLSTLHVEDMEDVVIIVDQAILMVMIIATATLIFKLWQWLRGSLKVITNQTRERPDPSTHILAEMNDMLRELRDHGRMLSGIATSGTPGEELRELPLLRDCGEWIWAPRPPSTDVGITLDGLRPAALEPPTAQPRPAKREPHSTGSSPPSAGATPTLSRSAGSRQQQR